MLLIQDRDLGSPTKYSTFHHVSEILMGEEALL